MTIDLKKMARIFDAMEIAGGLASPKSPAIAYGRALIDELTEARAQLPEGMKHCTIVFRECPLKHSWLTATNWEDFPCPWCARDEARRERDAKEHRIGAMKQALASKREDIATARAVAMEEAAQLMTDGIRFPEPGTPHLVVRSHAASAIRALAPLEASLVAVPKEAWEALRNPVVVKYLAADHHAVELRCKENWRAPYDDARDDRAKLAAALTALSAEVKP